MGTLGFGVMTLGTLGGGFKAHVGQTFLKGSDKGRYADQLSVPKSHAPKAVAQSSSDPMPKPEADSGHAQLFRMKYDKLQGFLFRNG